jgi:outer membrane biosynthesis protein TonB
MRRGAGAARRAHAQMGLATLAFLGLCALGFASSVALAGQASPQQVTTGEATTATTATTTAPSTAATTTAPVPDPKPPPPPKPDPKPRKATRVTPPPPPPPAPSPQAEAPQPAQPAQPTAVAPPPPPAPSPPALRTRQKTTTVAPAVTRPPGRTRLRSTTRAQAASRERSRFADDAGALAAPAPQLSETDSRVSGPLLAFVPLFCLGLLLLAASAISPWRVPWPAISEPLYLHRANLASIGIGTIALALLCLSIAVLL